MANPTQAQVEEAEKAIIAKLIEAAFMKNYTISVNDGEVMVLKKSQNKEAIMNVLFSTGEDYIFIREQDGKQVGMIYFIYGNTGWDVITDYSDNEVINGLVQDVDPLVEEYMAKFA